MGAFYYKIGWLHNEYSGVTINTVDNKYHFIKGGKENDNPKRTK